MDAFLILSSLGLMFYLVLLVALYRDGQRRRESGGTVWKTELGIAAGPSKRVSNGVSRIARRQTSSGDVLWIPVTRHHWKPDSRNAGSNRETLVYLEPVATETDRRCG